MHFSFKLLVPLIPTSNCLSSFDIGLLMMYVTSDPTSIYKISKYTKRNIFSNRNNIEYKINLKENWTWCHGFNKKDSISTKQNCAN